MPIAILADDLTGACDAGVEFARRGLRTIAWMPGQHPDAPADVAVFDTGSRGATSRAASAAVLLACEAIRAAGLQLAFKKIDSTLKGPLRAEIEALIDAGVVSAAVVAPANPRMGRTLADGWLEVDGRRPDPPVHLPSLVGSSSLPAPHVADAAALRDALQSGARVVGCDARTSGDLDAIAVAIADAGEAVLPVGSAGLAAVLAERLGGAASEAPGPPASRAVEIHAGSRNPVTLAQVEAVEHTPGVVVHRVSFGRYVPPAEAPGTALVLTGGDAAAHVLGALSARGIEIRGELEPGVPWGFIIGGTADGLVVATKPGGFGRSDTLVRVAERLRGVAPR